MKSGDSAADPQVVRNFHFAHITSKCYFEALKHLKTNLNYPGSVLPSHDHPSESNSVISLLSKLISTMWNWFKATKKGRRLYSWKITLDNFWQLSRSCCKLLPLKGHHHVFHRRPATATTTTTATRPEPEPCASVPNCWSGAEFNRSEVIKYLNIYEPYTHLHHLPFCALFAEFTDTIIFWSWP